MGAAKQFYGNDILKQRYMGQAIADRWNNADRNLGFWVNCLIIISGIVLGPCIASCPWLSLATKTFLLVVCGAVTAGLKAFEKLVGGSPISTDTPQVEVTQEKTTQV